MAILVLVPSLILAARLGWVLATSGDPKKLTIVATVVSFGIGGALYGNLMVSIAALAAALLLGRAPSP
jgi:hypothetical protein